MKAKNLVNKNNTHGVYLSYFGYSVSNDQYKRHKALTRAVKKMGTDPVFAKLNDIHEHQPLIIYKNIIGSDISYLKKISERSSGSDLIAESKYKHGRYCNDEDCHSVNFVEEKHKVDGKTYTFRTLSDDDRTGIKKLDSDIGKYLDDRKKTDTLDIILKIDDTIAGVSLCNLNKDNATIIKLISPAYQKLLREYIKRYCERYGYKLTDRSGGENKLTDRSGGENKLTDRSGGENKLINKS